MTTSPDDGLGDAEPSPWRARGREALVYFGLAEPLGETGQARRTDWYLIAFASVLFALIVGGRRGTPAGLIVFASFLPASTIGSLIALGRLDDRHTRLGDFLAIIPLTLSMTLLVSSRHTSVATIVAVDTAVLAVVFAVRFVVRRRAATRAAGRRTSS